MAEKVVVVWCGGVWWWLFVVCGVVWCGMVWCGVVWCGAVRCGGVVVQWCGGVVCCVLCVVCCVVLWLCVVVCGFVSCSCKMCEAYDQRPVSTEPRLSDCRMSVCEKFVARSCGMDKICVWCVPSCTVVYGV